MNFVNRMAHTYHLLTRLKTACDPRSNGPHLSHPKEHLHYLSIGTAVKFSRKPTQSHYNRGIRMSPGEGTCAVPKVDVLNVRSAWRTRQVSKFLAVSGSQNLAEVDLNLKFLKHEYYIAATGNYGATAYVLQIIGSHRRATAYAF